MGMLIDESITLLEDYLEWQKLHEMDGNGVDEATRNLIDAARKYQMMQADYENRLKADFVAMLTDMQLEFEEELNCGAYCDECHKSCEDIPAIWFLDFIQEKINALKGKGNNGNNVR